MTTEFRFDVLTGHHTALAPGRAAIGATRPGGLPDTSARCPFCPGHEAETEATVWSIGNPWDVRVVLNRFPLVEASTTGGRHELVVESRTHDDDLAIMTPARIAIVLFAYRERLRALERMPGVRAITLFRNRGRRAGSSQPHPHTQIVAMPIVPPAVALRDAIALADPRTLARLVDAERRAGTRVVRDADGWMTWCPFASWRAYEVRLAPTFACARFAHLEEPQLDALSTHLSFALAGLSRHMGLADYNVVLREPALSTRDAYFTIDVLPRTGGDAGFEIGSGTPVCVVAPEATAAALRR